MMLFDFCVICMCDFLQYPCRLDSISLTTAGPYSTVILPHGFCHDILAARSILVSWWELISAFSNQQRSRRSRCSQRSRRSRRSQRSRSCKSCQSTRIESRKPVGQGLTKMRSWAAASRLGETPHVPLGRSFR